MESYISATNAARSFSDLLKRVLYRGEEFVIERGGEPVCRMVPARPPRCTGADLVQLFRSVPKPDKKYWDVLEEITKGQPSAPKSPWQR